LILGDTEKAFSEPVRKELCCVCPEILDGIEEAAIGDFRTVAIVMSSVSAKLNAALRALRQAASSSRVILLAQMSEEPTAMQLVGTEFEGKSLVDDYLICPISAKKFYEVVTYSSGPEKRQDDLSGIQYDLDKIEQLEQLATVDELTGLKNRRYIWEFSRQIIEHARRENERVTLLLFDIDDFKHYNDVYNHSAGDEILKQAAVLMQRCCRPHDVVGRIGGDEFAVVFWDDPKKESDATDTERRSSQAEHPKEPIFIANRFRRELGRTELNLLGPAGKGILTISGGLASFPRDGSTIEQLFKQADKALLEAKRSGKNRIYLVGKSTNDIKDIE